MNGVPRTSVVPGDLLLGKYRVKRVLGEGAMGIVYEGEHEALAQRVAIKVLKSSLAKSAAVMERFDHEARATAKVESEHVARILDVGRLAPKNEHDGLPFMVMEYLEGRDFSEILDGRGRLPPAEAVGYVLEALIGLVHAHGLGIVHRDLKPANLFLTRRADGTSVVKVLDFGLSAMLELDPDRGVFEGADDAQGSPAYMAPERLDLACRTPVPRLSDRLPFADPRSDIWSVGVILYELLTGRLPFEAESMSSLVGAIRVRTPEQPSRLAPDVTPELDAIVLRCLACDPNDRWSDVAELALQLGPFGAEIGRESASRIVRMKSISDNERLGQMRAVSSNPPKKRPSTPVLVRSTPSIQPRFRRENLVFVIGLCCALAAGLAAAGVVLRRVVGSP